jgi:hypothetical protein
MTTIYVILVLLACWRLARLLTVDELTRPIRDRIAAKAGPDSQLTYLVTCSWCMSVWSSIPVVAAVVYWPTNRAVFTVVAVLAGSLVAGMGQTVEDRLDR